VSEVIVYQNKLIELLEHAYQIEQDLVASMSEQEKEAPGEPDHWAAKDELAHLAEWYLRLSRNIEAVKRGDEPHRNQADFNQTNVQIFEQFRYCSFAEVADLFQKGQQAIVDCLRGLSEEDLTSTEILPWSDGRPLWRIFVVNGYMHTVQHIAHIYNERGEAQKALAIQIDATELLASLLDNPEWKGLLSYNLACQYSLSGDKNRAIALLREGLALNPGLTEWSKQDPDLDPIRADPEYQAIYAA
jgi:hypothetical protein